MSCDEAETEEISLGNVAESLELQMSEIEMLSSMFPNKGEFRVDDPVAVDNVRDFLHGNIKYEFLHNRLGFSLNITPQGSKVNREM